MSGGRSLERVSGGDSERIARGDDAGGGDRDEEHEKRGEGDAAGPAEVGGGRGDGAAAAT